MSTELQKLLTLYLSLDILLFMIFALTAILFLRVSPPYLWFGCLGKYLRHKT